MSALRTSTILGGVALFLVSGVNRAEAADFSRPVHNVVDTNPDPNVFEADLSVDEHDAGIGGTTVHTLIYKDLNSPGVYAGLTDGIPILQIVVEVGDVIVVNLRNDLAANCASIACDTSIHWHGLELDEDSDGTGVTQNHLAAADTYTYRFLTHRPGVFWFHPHMIPGPQVFAGVYGAFIVRDPNETTLQDDGVVPPEGNTYTAVLSDIEFDTNGNLGFLNAGVTVPFGMLAGACAGGDMASCVEVADGDTVLVNGQDPASDIPIITAMSGEGIRLRLINTSTNRYFLLNVSNNGADNNLYRIGGEGGFLETVRLEGGVLGTWDTKYSQGEILIPASGRADVVIVPTGNDGDTIVISGLGYQRGGPSDLNAAGDLIHIVIDDTIMGDAFTIGVGDDVLGAGGVDDIKSAAINPYSAPLSFPGHPGDGAGSTNPIITLDAVAVGMTSIDGIVGHFEDSGPDFTQVPFQDATRYALTGDILEFTVTNGTLVQHHPFHHHGFSVQPVRVIDNGADLGDTGDDTVLYEFDYLEFVDVFDVQFDQSVVVRMRVEDRPRITDTRPEAGAPAPDQFFASGGAAGRWVFHCHLFLHAGTGMISELVVGDTDRDNDGFDTSEDCDDFNPDINPLAEEDCTDGVDNDCDGEIDEKSNFPCFGVRKLTIDKQRGKLSLDGSLYGGDFDPLTEDVVLQIEDDDGDKHEFEIKAGSFVLVDGSRPTFLYKTRPGEEPKIKAEFHPSRCKFTWEIARASNLGNLHGTEIKVTLCGGCQQGKETVRTNARRSSLHYRAQQFPNCCIHEE